MKTYIGIHNTTEHDANIAINIDNDYYVLIAERFDRNKHSNNRLIIKNIANNTFKEKIKIRETDLSYNPFQKINHHLAHAACSFLCSPFKNAAILIADGMGPYKDDLFASTSLWKASNNSMELINISTENRFCFNSLGHFYSAITYYCGFGFWEEGKTMGLAPYGSEGKISKNLSGFVKLLPEGKVEIDKDFIGFSFSLMYPNEIIFEKYHKNREYFTELFASKFGSYRKKGDQLLERHKNLAWAGQYILEKALLHIGNYLCNITKLKNLCIGGGVALNSVANMKILKNTNFENIYIPPVCGDDGLALGTLLYKKYVIDNKEKSWHLNHAYLGIEYTSEDITNSLKEFSSKITYQLLKPKDLVKKVAKLLTEQKIIGWFYGKSEIGPRALGHRSILADPRNKEMKDIINLRVKHREPFRPFAPSILNEFRNDYFYLEKESPFMLLVPEAKPKAIKQIPAVIHVDNTARVQTVTKNENDRYYDLIKAFYELTNVPVLLNTSFNDNGEPIVESPKDAIKAFLNLDLDVLVLQDYLVLK